MKIPLDYATPNPKRRKLTLKDIIFRIPIVAGFSIVVWIFLTESVVGMFFVSNHGAVVPNEQFLILQIVNNRVAAWPPADIQSIMPFTHSHWGPFHIVHCNAWRPGTAYFVMPTWMVWVPILAMTCIYWRWLRRGIARKNSPDTQ